MRTACLPKGRMSGALFIYNKFCYNGSDSNEKRAKIITIPTKLITPTVLKSDLIFKLCVISLKISSNSLHIYIKHKHPTSSPTHIQLKNIQRSDNENKGSRSEKFRKILSERVHFRVLPKIVEKRDPQLLIYGSLIQLYNSFTDLSIFTWISF